MCLAYARLCRPEKRKKERRKKAKTGNDVGGESRKNKEYQLKAERDTIEAYGSFSANWRFGSSGAEIRWKTKERAEGEKDRKEARVPAKHQSRASKAHAQKRDKSLLDKLTTIFNDHKLARGFERLAIVIVVCVKNRYIARDVLDYADDRITTYLHKRFSEPSVVSVVYQIINLSCGRFMELENSLWGIANFIAAEK
ncbi:hypothetical protein WN51_12268 [Melipona quadrifasciata]|uniref:Uncharacterized protein n=1 Tax=Melipona quadrifasciata TaxID=166423 RepID=A0A0N0U5N9_9HYME|nr:hypothetical protein WN51_12268 [Melipona quadrifasciata]